VVSVPAYFIYCEQMTLVGLLVLAGVGKGAFVDLALLSTDEEGEVVVFVEVET
jgi:hypothetical protein